ncbi:MAG: nucleotidyltransferase [Lentimicrobium sp.]|nr:nucleotidyltransferase [Lentimicrobium sp.]
MKPTLVILAAGMGSRYGGLKQIDPVGPSGETILDYSVYDAIRAGFKKAVFIIRKDIELEFKESFINKLQKYTEIDWVFQELETLPQGFSVPENRTKPWGTGHALLMVADKVKEPFAVINADDFYGADAYKTLADFFSIQEKNKESNYAMVAYELANTLSDFGSVSRGICKADENNWLKTVTERTKIERNDSGIADLKPDGTKFELAENELVSMNLWGFTPSIFNHLNIEFANFLRTEIDHTKSEFYIPGVVDRLIKSGTEKVKVLKNPGQWFGITYKEDKPIVVEKIKHLVKQGIYPEKLWE